ncbi:quinone-dependent dihydroorotate dehydrogenase [bacterium]|nr:quinone-dependent dihydroorotate dehydrogenase [bacterium]
MVYRRWLRPLLFQCDSEFVHRLAISVTKPLFSVPPLAALVSRTCAVEDPLLRCTFLGRELRNPLGLAAGFDKDVEMLPLLAALGFGHVEVGTVTPLPQPGNPKPRIFRVIEDEALVNRMGFPSAGMEQVVRHLRSGYARHLPMEIAVNIGKNRDTDLEDAARDYGTIAAELPAEVPWITVNVSSPNTPGLRSLQSHEGLSQIVSAIRSEGREGTPLLVKLSPDLSSSELEELLGVLLDLKVDGVVASNTTLSRDGLQHDPHEAGGVSGKPLFEHTLRRTKEITRITEGALPLIAVGGVRSWQDCVALLIEGATLVQGYTGFVYGGPAWPSEVLSGVRDFCKSQGISCIEELRGEKELLALL